MGTPVDVTKVILGGSTYIEPPYRNRALLVI
jgi:hypothetical protein